MPLLDTLASAFINVFGITQPSEATRRRASWFIASMLCLTLVGVTFVALLLFRILHH